ncbi:MAG: hypothetical protein P1V35_10230 [Planctomycetota bacterium]|nr:hypothetical protein [Planctomycetota bacterium]
MLKNLLMGIASLMILVSCQSTTAEPSSIPTSQAIVHALQVSGQSNGVDAQRAFAADQPLLLVFWQAW